MPLLQQHHVPGERNETSLETVIFFCVLLACFGYATNKYFNNYKLKQNEND